MEITIDTNKDSKEHIQHMIEFLQRFVGAQGSASSSLGTGGGLMGLFGDEASSVPDDAPQQEGIFGLFDDDDDVTPSSPPVPDEREDAADSLAKIEIVPY